MIPNDCAHLLLGILSFCLSLFSAMTCTCARYGLRRKMYSILSSYLNGRSQFVGFDNQQFDRKLFTAGVPQEISPQNSTVSDLYH